MLVVGFFLHDLRIEQARKSAKSCLAAVLHAKKKLLRASSVLFTARAPRTEQNFQAIQTLHGPWELNVAFVFEVSHRFQTARAPRMARNENQFVVSGPRFGPF